MCKDLEAIKREIEQLEDDYAQGKISWGEYIIKLNQYSKEELEYGL